MRVIKICLLLGACLYLALTLIFYSTQRSLLYYPAPISAHLVDAPNANPAFRELEYRTEDGLAQVAWFALPKAGHPTLVFFHGNGDALATVAPLANAYIAAGYGFLLVEYRGYSHMPGAPTETGLYRDARGALHALLAQGVPSGQVVLMAHSLGTGVATQMATEFSVAGVVLFAPYTSIPDVAAPMFPIFPVHLLARDHYNSLQRIQRIHAPLLVMNGSSDEVIPPEQGQKLYAAANEPKHFQQLPGLGHNDLLLHATPLVLDWLGHLPH